MNIQEVAHRFLTSAVISLLAVSLSDFNDARGATNYTESFLPGPQLNRTFGRSLEMDGDTLAVSLALTPESGGVYIYKLLENIWVLTATLNIAAEPGDDDFGADVALDAFLLAGTPNRNSAFKGSVLILRPAEEGTDWLPQATLLPPNEFATGRFGSSVAKDGSTIAVAAPTEESGVVYVYAGVGDPTWQLQARLTASDSGQTDSFSQVELSGNTLLVDSGDDAYVFERSGTNWIFQARLAPPTTNSLPGSAALDQNVAVVNGFVFVRHGTNWIQTQQLVPSPVVAGFGRSAAIEGNTIVVSAWDTFYSSSTQGTAFVFQYDGSSWVQMDQLTPGDLTGVSGEYGLALAIDGGRIVVGDPNHIQNDILMPTGAAHVWTPLASAPSPAVANAEVYNGFVVAINITDQGSGFTYPPLVRLIGGGGSGASAVASVVSNRLESIQIVNSGSGYTSAPTVVIQLPAQGPGASEFLDLRITYASVTFDLVPGKRYLLESSFDRSTWTALDEPFVALQEALTANFPVEQTGRFFRLTEIGTSSHSFADQNAIESEQILAPPAPTESRDFGRSVAIDNGTAVTSGWSTNTTDYGGGIGELFFYDLDGSSWRFSQSYVHVRTLPTELGASLAMEGDVLVAGAPWFNDFRQINGTARLLARSGTNWVSQDTLAGEQRYNVGRFGSSVAISGQTIAVINPDESIRNPENGGVELAAGAAYVFADSSLQAKLSATNSNTTNTFRAVALSGDTLFVSSGNEAIVFSRTGSQWNYHSVISPSGTNFPGIALDGGIALVNGYVIVRNGDHWTEFQKLDLTPTKTNQFDELYGPSVAIDGGTIVVGADGAVSVFDFIRTNWVETLVLKPENSSAQPNTYGQSVAISGNRIMVGDPYSDLFGTRSGAVYIYTRATGSTRPATAIAEVVNGYVVGFNIIDGGAGYSYAPSVEIIGGGGSGASAVASIESGTVTALRVLNPGSGYNSIPAVLADSPSDPIGAPVAAVSRPTRIAVDLHLVLGKQYLLESSSDLRNWKQAAGLFLADEALLSQEFTVEELTQFFRLNVIDEYSY